MKKSSLFVAASAAIGILAIQASSAAQAAVEISEGNIIQLTQTPCQFVEVEGTDHGFVSTKKADCVAINKDTGEQRLAKSQTLKLKPGDYTFRVTNKNVPYNLGFWIRGAGIVGRATLPSASGGGLKTGVTKDYKITLKPGEYLFSCPLNNTPDYKVVVEG